MKDKKQSGSLLRAHLVQDLHSSVGYAPKCSRRRWSILGCPGALGRRRRGTFLARHCLKPSQDGGRHDAGFGPPTARGSKATLTAINLITNELALPLLLPSLFNPQAPSPLLLTKGIQAEATKAALERTSQRSVGVPNAPAAKPPTPSPHPFISGPST